MKGLLFWVACGTALLVTAFSGRFASPERWEYSEIAAHLLDGRGAFHDYLGTRYYFYGSALYPLILSAVLWVSHHEAVMLVLQAFMFAATCLVIYRVGTLLVAPSTVLLGATLAAFHPGNLVYVGKLHSQTLDVLLVTLSFLILLKVTIASSWLGTVKMIGAGAVLGLAALSRGTVMPWCAVWAGWWLWRSRLQMRQPIRVVGCLAVGGLLMLSPIVAQGYHRYGRLIPLRTDTGVNLWYGNHPGASGTSYTLGPNPVPVIATLPSALAGQLAGKTEVEQHELFTQATVDFVRHEPAAALRLFLRKLGYFWWFSPHTGLLYPARWTTAYRLYYLVIAGCALLGLLICFRSGRSVTRMGARLFALLAVSLSVTQAVFYVEGRHRWQLEPLLLVFTAVGLTQCWQSLRKRC